MNGKRISVFLRLARENRSYILLFIFLGMFVVAAEVAMPLVSRQIVDQGFIGRDWLRLWRYSWHVLLLFLFSRGVLILIAAIRQKVTARLTLGLTRQFLEKLFALDTRMSLKLAGGDYDCRLYDVSELIEIVLKWMPGIVLNLLQIIGTGYVLLRLSPLMFLAFLLTCPFFFLRLLTVRKRMLALSESLWSIRVDVWKMHYESFSRILLIKANGYQDIQIRLFLKTLAAQLSLKMREFWLITFNDSVDGWATKLIYGLFLLYGGWLISRGELSVGTHAAVMLYFARLSGLIKSQIVTAQYFLEQSVGVRKVCEVLDAPVHEETADKDHGTFSAVTDIRFDRVSFGYDRSCPVLQDVSCVVSGGGWSAVVGRSGAGKTTMAYLMVRLFDPQAGEIRLGTVSLRGVAARTLHNHVGIVTQQPLLFNCSVRDNIAFGLPEVADEEVVRVARSACLHEDIMRLPQGYQTPIGDDGVFLSQGMRQRVVLARIFLRNPPVLILDEATSSLDPQTEKNIFRYLKTVRQGLTTVVISHRFYPVSLCSHVIFLGPQGVVVEGSHDQLAGAHPAYRVFFGCEPGQPLPGGVQP